MAAIGRLRDLHRLAVKYLGQHLFTENSLDGSAKVKAPEME
jgi:hypothetical protein